MLQKILFVFTIVLSLGLGVNGQILTVTPADQGVCNGGVEIINPNQYTSWNWQVDNQSISNTASSLSNLCYGSQVTVFVFNGNIQDSSTVFIDTLNSSACGGFMAAITQTEPASNQSTCDAQLACTITGGTAPYAYSWSGNSASTTAFNTEACVGLNYVIITDATGCTYTAQITAYADTLCDNFLINASTTNTSDDVSCDGTGTAFINAGTAPYLFDWGVGTGTNTIQGLCYGTGVLTITDANGCTATTSYFVDSNTICTGFQVALAQGANATSPVSCDAVIYSTVQGGTMPLLYDWNYGSSVTSATNSEACSGFNILTVTDINGCTATATINIQANTTICDSLQASLSSSPSSTSNLCDGSANAFAEGGIAPYMYEWTFTNGNNQNTQNVSDLCYGAGSLIVTDANGCIDTLNFYIDTLNNSNPCNGLVVTLTQVQSCSSPTDCDGIIQATVSGGVAPFTYAWSVGVPMSGAINNSACPGQNIVTVTDAMGCTYTAQIYVQTGSSNCNGFTLGVSVTQSLINSCTGTADVNISGGTMPYQIYWNGVPGSMSVQNLCTGYNSVYVYDNAGCSDTLDFYIDSISNSISASVYVTPESYTGACDGLATVYPYGGVSPFTYSHSNGATTQTATGLCAGIYSVVVTDANGNSYSLQYLISSPSNSSSGNGGYTGTPIDTLYSALVENCNIDYTTIDTMYASSFAQFGSDSLVVTWAIIQGVDTSYMTYTYDLSNTNPTGTGLTNVVLTIYCPFRGLGEYWMVSDNIILENGTSGISENEIAEIKVYQQFDDLSVWVILPNETHFTACLYDVTGKRIFEKSLFGQKEKINLDNVSKGKYVLTIQTEKLFKNTLISK